MSRAVAAAAPDLEQQLERLGRPIRRRPLKPGRSHVAAALLAIVAVWLVVVFAGTLGELDRATQRRAAALSESTALQQRLDADRRELALVQTDAFQAMMARAYGMGAPGEQAFSLQTDVSPPPIVPLGRATETPPEQLTPLDAWLELLFGD